MPPKSRRKEEFGDFQTPAALAKKVCSLLHRWRPSYRSVLEPTCGEGTFLDAAAQRWDNLEVVTGMDINPQHIAVTQDRMARHRSRLDVSVSHADFFSVDWSAQIENLPDPLLVIGNPPWVTNSALMSIGSSNVPIKLNLKQHAGLDALTGKSNFDISEWMLVHLGERLRGRTATLAMLCKTAVARRVLQYAWTRSWPGLESSILAIDAAEWFQASVSACLLVIDFGGGAASTTCSVFDSLDAHEARSDFGLLDGRLVSDFSACKRWSELLGRSAAKWRSGIKHDCAKAMEFRFEGGRYVNGWGESVELEPDHLYPLWKSSDVARGSLRGVSKWMLVPQTSIGEHTSHIAESAPNTWAYLLAHGEQLDRRRSTIYRNRPRFSVFGVGDYTFTPWKVAISSLYKHRRFRVIGPCCDRPVVFDDTCYFYPCRDQAEAELVAELLQSRPAMELLDALVFDDAKRPVTAEILGSINLSAVAAQVGRLDEFESVSRTRLPNGRPRHTQRSLFPA